MRTAKIYHSFTVFHLLAMAVVLSACQAAAESLEGTLAVLSTESAELGTKVASQATIISHLATRGPARVTRPAGTVEPADFQPVRGFVEIAINWVGLYVSVQYMDKSGNISSIYYDDISVEGHP